MIFTVGYSRLTQQSLAALAAKLQAIVTDCRAKPMSRWKPDFNRTALQKLLGPRYEWWGDRLGGWPPGAKQHSTTKAGIRELRLVSKQANRLLLCAEEHPKDCHRHSLICGPHFPDAVHIYRGETFTAEALSAEIAAGHRGDLI